MLGVAFVNVELVGNHDGSRSQGAFWESVMARASGGWVRHHVGLDGGRPTRDLAVNGNRNVPSVERVGL